MGWLLRLLGWLAVVLAVVGVVVWLNFDQVRYSAIMWMTTPSKPFAEPQSFDYASTDGWAALPDASATAPVDVFVVPGTHYFKPYKDSWNEPADDAETRLLTSLISTAGSPMYKDCCKIYLPHFRQAILGAFGDMTDNGRKALDLAYGDVERAFDYYIAHYNNGRPFILAGASQGGRHIFALLKNRISGTELRTRMVAAYPLIWWIRRDQYEKQTPDIPVCSDATQTGCVVTFNPVGPHLRRGLNPLLDQDGIICVNPLTWRTDGAYAGFELNLGSRTFGTTGKLVPGAADAECDKTGRLVVSEVRADMYEGASLPLQLIMGMFGRDNHHSIAGGLFYANLKKNVDDRVAAYQVQTKSEPQAPG
jgi:hypothetical protein